MKIAYHALVGQALLAREAAYAPYSHFAVGAALLARTGEIYTGCNIESVSYSPSCCAERVAFYKAISDGRREFSAICIAGGPVSKDGSLAPCYPCGVCRQVMSEFCGDSFEILIAQSEGVFWRHTLRELLPYRFDGLGSEAAGI